MVIDNFKVSLFLDFSAETLCQVSRCQESALWSKPAIRYALSCFFLRVVDRGEVHLFGKPVSAMQ